MKEHFKLMGLEVTDAVTGVTGVVTSICFDLYGCVAALVQPMAEKGKVDTPNAHWFDTKRLKAMSKKPVMALPDFAIVPGGQIRPAR